MCFFDEDCNICCSGEEERANTTEGCCSFGVYIDLLVSENAFMRGNPEESDRGFRRNGGVEDVHTRNEWGSRREVNNGRESYE